MTDTLWLLWKENDMARYIDADALIERLKFKRDETDINGKKHSGLECAIAQVQKQPTADVVPKSEVEELKADLEVWKQNRFNIFQRLELYKMTRQEVAREIFAEIDRAVENAELEWGTICGVKLCIAELKKKYTEGE
jgi:ADP-dependent phosphofructokinase/glucokinase